MKYSLTWLERKETVKGPKWNATVQDEKGAEYKNVTLWFSEWPEVMTGQTVEATLSIKQNGQYENKTLYKEKTYGGVARQARAAVKPAEIAEAQAKKAEYIHQAQDRKNESIAYFNSINSAIQFLSAFPEEKPQGMTSFEAIKQIRDSFLAEWQKYEAQDHKDKHNAF